MGGLLYMPLCGICLFMETMFDYWNFLSNFINDTYSANEMEFQIVEIIETNTE